MPNLEALMVALMTWASAHTGLPMVEPPAVAFKTSCELATLLHRSCVKESPIHGIYVPEAIFLHSQWRASSLADVGLLLHELVHHMQYHAGIPPVPCKEVAYERQAYEAQFAFLKASGLVRPGTKIPDSLIECPKRGD